MKHYGPLKQLLCFAFLFTLLGNILADQCRPNEIVYGENHIIDELAACSLARSFDLDLTPHSEHSKSTGRPLVEQGLSNRTAILHAKLSGLWTTKRADFVESGWKCEEDQVSSTSVLEITGLSLEVIERIDIPMHKNQHKLTAHKPCKLFDLPNWMCRRQKAVYRTISTWVNRAYLSVTLVQKRGQTKPSIGELAFLFTCPETFKQKIVYSPSATYVLARHLHSQVSKVDLRAESKVAGQRKRALSKQSVNEMGGSSDHPSSHSVTQSGQLPALPPYHSSVRIIRHHTLETLRATLNECIHTHESDLALIGQHNSFALNKYQHPEFQINTSRLATDDELSAPILGECSNRLWLKNRLELSDEASKLADGAIRPQHGQQNGGQLPLGGHTKRRMEFFLDYPSDPNQLLNPYGYYHENSALDQMIDDERR